MTAPFGEQQQQDGQLGNQQGSRTEDAIVAALAAALLIRAPGLNWAWPGARLKRRLVDELGLSPKAVDKASELALALVQPPPAPYDFTTTTVARVQAEAPNLVAQYLVNSAKRLDSAQRHGQYDAGARLEDIYAGQAKAAAANRVRAATALDHVAANSPTGRLKWVAVMDHRTTPDCAALDGTIFALDNLPQIAGRDAVPGAVHARCRCSAAPVMNKPALSLVR